MKTTYYAINIGSAKPDLIAKIAEVLMPFYSSNNVIMSGQVTVIDDSPASDVHIDTETMPVPDMRKLRKDAP